VNFQFEWDSGMFSHDLYLVYYVTIDCKRAVTNNAGSFFGGFVNWAGLSGFAVHSNLESSFKAGFEAKMKWGICSLAGYRVEDGHNNGCRF
jgi:hypothetical protein